VTAVNTAAADPQKRDRARTEAGIVAAARDVLAEQGFQGFGVNAVARRAGCDKQLIYRYFGGIDGLVTAIGAELATWLGDRLTHDPAPATSYAMLAERLILGFLDALRADPLVQKICAWEISDPSPLVAQLAAARGAAIGVWFAREKRDQVPPPGVDGAAINTMLIAAVQMLVLSGSTAGGFAGVPLATDSDWDRIRAAVRALIAAAYGKP
jgi:AcrR family transcriptional regulator